MRGSSSSAIIDNLSIKRNNNKNKIKNRNKKKIFLMFNAKINLSLEHFSGNGGKHEKPVCVCVFWEANSNILLMISQESNTGYGFPIAQVQELE